MFRTSSICRPEAERHDTPAPEICPQEVAIEEVVNEKTVKEMVFKRIRSSIRGWAAGERHEALQIFYPGRGVYA